MKEKSMGFVGGGRVARIILGGFEKAGRRGENNQGNVPLKTRAIVRKADEVIRICIVKRGNL
jgi:hypothetical protein